MMGLRIGTRMTLVRLRGGGLLLHSALPLTEARRRAVDTHGVLTHIVAPNAFHHRFAPEWANAYPNAIVHGPLELRKKSPGLRLDRLLSDPPDRDWSATLEPLTIWSKIRIRLITFPRASTCSSPACTSASAGLGHCAFCTGTRRPRAGASTGFLSATLIG